MKPKSKDPQSKLTIWVMSDGTAGMRFQAIALAQAITAARPDSQYHDHIVQPHRIPRSFPSLAGAISLFPPYGIKQPAPKTGHLTTGHRPSLCRAPAKPPTTRIF